MTNKLHYVAVCKHCGKTNYGTQYSLESHEKNCAKVRGKS